MLIQLLNFTDNDFESIINYDGDLNDETVTNTIKKFADFFKNNKSGEVYIKEMFRLYERIDHMGLLDAGYDSNPDEFFEKIENAINNYSYTEVCSAVKTLSLRLSSFRNLMGCIHNDLKNETSLYFLVEEAYENSKSEIPDTPFFLKVEKNFYLKIYKEAIDGIASYFENESSWDINETILLFCKVEKSPLHKYPVYIPMDFLLKINGELV